MRIARVVTASSPGWYPDCDEPATLPEVMNTRRSFISTTAIGTSASLLAIAQNEKTKDPSPGSKPATQGASHYCPPTRFGLGGVAIGNGFRPSPHHEALSALDAAWSAGVRYYDTAPFYGFGLSERRFGLALGQYTRDEFVLSTKVGRLLRPGENPDGGLWKDPPAMKPVYDYSASGARRSVEDSLQRLGLSRIDVVFIHDLSPDNFGDQWITHFQTARKGAMVELTRMREEGLIKGWGLGVNRIEPILRTLEVADADLFLCATRYSLLHQEEALEKLFPACEEKAVNLIIGAPLHAGFLAGRERYNYGGDMPAELVEKRRRLRNVAARHQVDLRTAALQFAAAPQVVSLVLPGARDARQAKENAESMKAKIPAGFWDELRSEGLISSAAPLPS